ncbi:MAG: peptidase domain-containing ABC transporter [Ignavibacteria bacterium]|nr:peptidase domain-containing ABC transporter [Ignavibacteria bacterium]
MVRLRYPVYRQYDSKDCGPTCVRMIAKYYGKSYQLQTLRDRSYISREGVTLRGISDAAESIGFKTRAGRVNFDQLKEIPLPCILHWRQNHFVVLYKVTKDRLVIADPAHGLITYTKKDFLDEWSHNSKEQGIVLMIEPTPDFKSMKDEGNQKGKGFTFLFDYLTGYKRHIIQLVIGAVVGSLIGLLFPLLTQSLVDYGVNTQNTDFVTLMLVAQLVLFFSRTSVEFIRSWILLHIGARINISIVSDFLMKLMKLPMSYFDTKMIGDILQRIGDHKRVEGFLTSNGLNVIFSIINILVFGVLMAVYSMKMALIFGTGSIAAIGWVFIFMRKRAELDYKRFAKMSENQSSLIQLINGMQEIKLNTIETEKRWEWERLQANLFQITVKSLSLGQYQQAGLLFINELKNIIITFLAANEVIHGNMTLGMMMSVSYIIGALNSPIDQLLGFFSTAQDARLSLERIREIHTKDDEENDEQELLSELPADKAIRLHNINFHYDNPHAEPTLSGIDCIIPAGKTTAIVGVSGSGKTTLLKLLLKFYKPTTGEIRIGNSYIENISTKVWREHCGVVMQDGFIFSDTIARNVAPGDEHINRERLMYAVEVANIKEFIESLPLGYTTKIGQDGHGLSQGQKQRILIARAVYKNPDYLFFDEATSALDANNERAIMEKLGKFCAGKTVLVIAHRLSTVKNADQILVLDRGTIVERGTHDELTAARGMYYHLVKNQLELGN